MDTITIRGARTHNLSNIDVDLPRNKLIVITGLSGSGKSSLAFDTIYAEGQRRYVESLSAYARQFLSLMEKPDVDLIEGLSPAISIDQKATSHNPRSTVGTVTEIYDYLRLLFARVGDPRCPEHGVSLEAQTVSQMVDQVLALPEGTRILVLAPVIRDRKGEYAQLMDKLRTQGFIRARIDGDVYELDDPPTLKKNYKHTIEVVVDRLTIRADHEQRLAESFETALELAEGAAKVVVIPGETAPDVRELLFSSKYACEYCGYSLAELEPRLFSFNNPAGACGVCDGLGTEQFFDPARIIYDPELSLAAGALQGWDRRNAFYFNLLKCLARHYKFNVEAPFARLPKRIRNIILHGSGDERIKFTYLRGRGRGVQRTHRFEGVIPNMARRYRETESSSVREDLAKFISAQSCDSCNGTRLRTEARFVFVAEHAINDITRMSIGQAHSFFDKLALTGHRAKIAERIVKEIKERLGFLVNVGLEYLTLERSAETLSGGEAQRIRLASQIGSGLVGVMYVLDEPSIGLHQRDNARLLKTLTRLRDLGNTVIVVEHDEEAMRAADHVLDLGPGAGIHGGRVVAQGKVNEIQANAHSLTGRYLAGTEQVPLPDSRTEVDPERQLSISGAAGNNLRHIDVAIPVGLLTCVTGVSGSGKSTLINDTLFPAITQKLHKSKSNPAPFSKIDGIEHLDKIIDIDQSPIGRTPRSNPATYTGLFTPIRELFSHTQEARAR
ncbi:MAG: excinuclease ABC subunit UvrA, partial [Gammaproteobacteria bacterium]|nr:excinuclease ABC subunit UvrA [Gammaproteobacteria bacterium]